VWVRARVRVCMRLACVHACVLPCVCPCVRARARACVRECARACMYGGGSCGMSEPGSVAGLDDRGQYHVHWPIPCINRLPATITYIGLSSTYGCIPYTGLSPVQACPLYRTVPYIGLSPIQGYPLYRVSPPVHGCIPYIWLSPIQGCPLYIVVPYTGLHIVWIAYPVQGFPIMLTDCAGPGGTPYVSC
jgi:hypothetical protein